MAPTDTPLPATAVILPLLALLTLILDSPPLIWHIQNRNIGAASLVFWFAINNLFNFINPLIWPTDDISKWYRGYGLCDIEVKMIPASYVGVIGSLIAIMRSLARILDTKATTLAPSRAQKVRQRVIDLFLCFGFPSIVMFFHYVVQQERYTIVTVMGCYTTYHLSWMSIFLIFMWPPLLSLIVVYYCILVIHRMRKYRQEFSSVLSSSSSNLTKSRFLRLFVISVTLVLVLIPTQTYLLLDFAKQINTPYSWKDVHGPNWGNIILMPFHGVVGPEYWIQIAAGFLVFAFFGLGQDAQEQYRQWLLKLGFGRVFSSLQLTVRERRRMKSTSGSQTTSSFGSSVRMLKKGLKRSSVTSSHHKSRSSTPTASPPLSPPAPPYDSLPPLRFPRSGSPNHQMTAMDKHLLEPLPSVHSSPSRFHKYFQAASVAAPDRRVAGGLGGFGAGKLPPRMDPYDRDYDPV